MSPTEVQVAGFAAIVSCIASIIALAAFVSARSSSLASIFSTISQRVDEYEKDFLAAEDDLTLLHRKLSILEFISFYLNSRYFLGFRLPQTYVDRYLGFQFDQYFLLLEKSNLYDEIGELTPHPLSYRATSTLAKRRRKQIDLARPHFSARYREFEQKFSKNASLLAG